MSLKDKRVHSSFVGLPPRPCSLWGLDQMTNCVVFDWYSILIIRYCSFKDGDYVRSCLPFVRFVIHAALVIIHGKIHAVRYQCPYFLYAWFYFLTPHVYSMPDLRPMNGTTLNVGSFVVLYHQETNCNLTSSLLSQYVGRTVDFTHAPDLRRVKEPKFIYKFRFRHFLKMTDSMKFGPEW